MKEMMSTALISQSNADAQPTRLKISGNDKKLPDLSDLFDYIQLDIINS